MLKKQGLEKIKAFLKNRALDIILGIPTIAAMISAIKKKVTTTTLSSLEVVLVIMIFTVFIVFIGYRLWSEKSYKSYSYPKKKINPTYIINKKLITYNRTADDKLHYSRELEIEALAYLDCLIDKYIWTGKSSVKKLIPTKNIREINSENVIGVWKYFRIVLDKPILKNQSDIISYSWPEIQNCSSSSPFVSSNTDNPTKELVMKVSLGEEYANRKLYLEEFRAIESDFPLSCQTVEFDEHGSYEWKVNETFGIKRFRYYRMRWSWDLSNTPPVFPGN